MKNKPKILFAAFEADPFAKTGGLGDVAGSLPPALSSAGADVRLIMPKLSVIPQRYLDEMVHVADFYVDLGWRHQYCGLDTLTYNGIVCYFIDNEYYFKRDGVYGYPDDGERAAFFCKGVLESIAHIEDFKPDILHCNDWHTALIPVFLRAQYSWHTEYLNLKTIFTIHNLRYQGICPRWSCSDLLGINDEDACYLGLADGDTINFMRGALCCSDLLTTVSPTYADEICSDFYGERMQDIFVSRRGALTGILNGIDTEKYNPAADENLYEKYDEGSFEKKLTNKQRFQRDFGLKVDDTIPLAVVVSRLTEQKGLDLLIHILSELLNDDVQLAVLGVGDQKYEEAFRKTVDWLPEKAAAWITFDESLSRKFYAAADIAIIPSLFEPCGLTQMIAMRYGTLPVVRETGGLKDSVEAYNRFTGAGTGFSFANYNAHELLYTMKEAVSLYRSNRPQWNAMVERAMRKDFSWAVSAKKYMDVYNRLLK